MENSKGFERMKVGDLKKLEEEFKKLIYDNRHLLFRNIAYIFTHCANCQVQQQKMKKKPWELIISGEVTDMVSELVSGELPPTIRKFAEDYRSAHINYNCEKGVKNITKIYETLKNCPLSSDFSSQIYFSH